MLRVIEFLGCWPIIIIWYGLVEDLDTGSRSVAVRKRDLNRIYQTLLISSILTIILLFIALVDLVIS